MSENKIDKMLKNVSRFVQLNHDADEIGVFKANEPKQLKAGFVLYALNDGYEAYENPTLKFSELSGIAESDFGVSNIEAYNDNYFIGTDIDTKIETMYRFIKVITDPNSNAHKRYYTEEEIEAIRAEENGVIEW